MIEFLIALALKVVVLLVVVPELNTRLPLMPFVAGLVGA